MRCKNCNIKFEVKYFNQKYCLNTTECISAFNRSIQLQIKTKRQKENKNKLKGLEPVSYWKKILQAQVNLIVRLIDKGCNCISSNRPYKDTDECGHFASRGSNPALQFNLFNMYSQSVHDNQHLSGNLLEYRNNLELLGLYDYYLAEKLKYQTLKISKEEIKDAIQIAKSIILELKSKNQEEILPRTIEKRVELRQKYQKLLNIYK